MQVLRTCNSIRCSLYLWGYRLKRIWSNRQEARLRHMTGVWMRLSLPQQGRG
jgi:hypothetical protein